MIPSHCVQHMSEAAFRSVSEPIQIETEFRFCSVYVWWVNDVAQSEKSHIPFANLLKTVWTVSPKSQI